MQLTLGVNGHHLTLNDTRSQHTSDLRETTTVHKLKKLLNLPGVVITRGLGEYMHRIETDPTVCPIDGGEFVATWQVLTTGFGSCAKCKVRLLKITTEDGGYSIHTLDGTSGYVRHYSIFA